MINAEDLIKYAKKSLKNKKFIVAIQREPYVNIKTNDGIKLEKVAGGAHILLDGILRQIGGLMVAIGSGNADAEIRPFGRSAMRFLSNQNFLLLGGSRM